MEPIAIIPVRGGSKRIPGKNLEPVGDRSLLKRSVDLCREAGMPVWVTTDDPELAIEAIKWGASVIHRTHDLARDDTPTLPVIQDAVERLGDKGLYPNWIVTLQVTFPFTTLKSLQKVLEVLDIRKYDSVVTSARVPHVFSPSHVTVPTITGHHVQAFPVFTAGHERQAFWSASNIIATARSVLLFSNSLYGYRRHVIEVPRLEVFDIDDPEDLEMARMIEGGRHED